MFAVISDIHSNLEALESALRFIKEQNIRKIYCTGDLVGYGPNPNEVIELIRDENIPCCMGNHDAAVIEKTDITYFNEYAAEAVLWTRQHITPENAKFLEELPLSFADGNFRFVHASPAYPEDWSYLYSSYEAEYAMDFFEEQICFYGHTHRPVIFSENGKQIFENSVELVRGEKYLINVGSVGQPRDGDPRACVMLFDEEKFIASYVRIGYDVDRVRIKILHAGLPVFLGERLLYGS
jgi:diadenosine tetraphosphatase ApaH/serine/threonine PP2A family protein phosphatase